MAQDLYFTVEFVCDTQEQREQLLQELIAKYDIAARKESGTTISMWDSNQHRTE